MLPSTTSPKSFWERPEGKTGGLFMIGILTALGIGLYKILPYLLTLVTNTIYLVSLLAVLGALLYVLTSASFRKFTWFLYKVAMRKLTGILITIDPIEILKIHINNLRDKQGEMLKKIELVNGQKVKLKRTIDDNNQKIERAKSIAKKANEMGDRGEVSVQMREVGRNDKLNQRLSPLQTKLHDLHAFLLKLHKNSDYIIRDMEGEIRANEIEYKAVKEGSNAIKSAKSILAGGEDEMYKQAIDFLEEDMSNKIGEIDQFMRTTDSIIRSMDYENMVFEEKGLQMLEQFNSSEFDYLINKDAKSQPNSPELIMIPKSQSKPSSHISGLLD